MFCSNQVDTYCSVSTLEEGIHFITKRPSL